MLTKSIHKKEIVSPLILALLVLLNIQAVIFLNEEKFSSSRYYRFDSLKEKILPLTVRTDPHPILMLILVLMIYRTMELCR